MSSISRERTGARPTAAAPRLASRMGSSHVDSGNRPAARLRALLRGVCLAHAARAGAPEVVEHAAPSSPGGLREALARARTHRAACRDVVVQLHGRYALDSTLDLGRHLLPPSQPTHPGPHHGSVTLRGPAALDGGVRISG
jgi:hypothetical protein